MVEDAIIIRTVVDGTVLLQEGQQSKEAFILIHGRVAVSRRAGTNQETLLAELGEGDFFGEMSLIDASPCSATVTAMGEVQVQVLNKNNFFEALQQNVKTMQTVVSSMFYRVRGLNKQMASLEEQLSNLTKENQKPASNHTLLKGLTEPARHAIYDMHSIVVDEFPYQIGRWSKKQSKTSWFSNNKVRNHVNIHDIAPYLISRQHCCLEKKGDAFYVIDLGSRLGTWVNGTKIGGNAQRQAKLSSGSNTIHIGEERSHFAFEVIIP